MGQPEHSIVILLSIMRRIEKRSREYLKIKLTYVFTDIYS